MRTGHFRCYNYGSCRSADSRAIFQLTSVAPLCPECKRPLVLIPPKNNKQRLFVGIVGIVALCGLCVLAWKIMPKHSQTVVVGKGGGDFRISPSNQKVRLPDEIFADTRLAQLTSAALKGDAITVSKLHASGIDINGRGKNGVTPLHIALLNLNYQAFFILLDNGANPNIKAETGDTALTLSAIIPDHRFLASALKFDGKVDQLDARKETPLMLAASYALKDNVELLVKAGADVNARDARGNTPLIHVFQAMKPNVEIAKTLISSGARADDSNPAGLTAKDYAGAFDNPSLLEVFSK
ncbi:MAG: hypothetical protein D4R39_03130 [Methylophilaceae bacterium]|nr:MAG: hypothetical protein D4R39_03130 [Methylophilaceae bacterium]